MTKTSKEQLYIVGSIQAIDANNLNEVLITRILVFDEDYNLGWGNSWNAENRVMYQKR